MNRTVEQINPIGTTACRNPNCDEIIYRDTLDKDLGYRVSDGKEARYTCSMECGASLVDSDELWGMALEYKTNLNRIDIAEARRILNL